MAVDAVAALLLGRLFDRLGMPVIMGTAALSAFFAPLVFLGGFGFALAGMVLWGIGMGALESIIKAALAEMVPRDRRGTGFGLFNAGFGLTWFLGSALMGFLYEFSLVGLVVFSVASQLLAIPFFLAVSKEVCLLPR
jgi:MFS family permease